MRVVMMAVMDVKRHGCFENTELVRTGQLLSAFRARIFFDGRYQNFNFMLSCAWQSLCPRKINVSLLSVGPN